MCGLTKTTRSVLLGTRLSQFVDTHCIVQGLCFHGTGQSAILGCYYTRTSTLSLGIWYFDISTVERNPCNSFPVKLSILFLTWTMQTISIPSFQKMSSLPLILWRLEKMAASKKLHLWTVGSFSSELCGVPDHMQETKFCIYEMEKVLKATGEVAAASSPLPKAVWVTFPLKTHTHKIQHSKNLRYAT